MGNYCPPVLSSSSKDSHKYISGQVDAAATDGARFFSLNYHTLHQILERKEYKGLDKSSQRYAFAGVAECLVL